jgi:hypothetical protein
VREPLNDHLLQPSLQGYRAPGSGGGPPPFPLGPQFYVAFVGGPLAATWITWLNSGRLDLPWRRRLAMLAVGIVATAAVIAAGGYLAIHGGLGPARDRDSVALYRVGSRAFALLLFGLFYAMQKSQDRLYQVNVRPLLYTRLFWPGVYIALISAFASFVLSLAAMRLWTPAP